MIKPVDTRWDSKSRMIARALYLKPAIEDICTRKSYVAKYNTGRLKLGREEWLILMELEPLLGVCIMFCFFREHILILILLLGRHFMTYRSRCRRHMSH
jgi:hypothetical protein